jgi:hypothetical protein
MEIIKWGDIVFLGFLLLAAIWLIVVIRVAVRKGWIRCERISWRETENHVRRIRRRAEKK